MSNILVEHKGLKTHEMCLMFTVYYRMNTVRLWVPQLLATLNEASHLNTTGITTMCGMIGSVVKSKVPSHRNDTHGERICLPVSMYNLVILRIPLI